MLKNVRTSRRWPCSVEAGCTGSSLRLIVESSSLDTATVVVVKRPWLSGESGRCRFPLQFHGIRARANLIPKNCVTEDHLIEWREGEDLQCGAWEVPLKRFTLFPVQGNICLDIDENKHRHKLRKIATNCNPQRVVRKVCEVRLFPPVDENSEQQGEVCNNQRKTKTDRNGVDQRMAQQGAQHAASGMLCDVRKVREQHEKLKAAPLAVELVGGEP